MTLSTSCAETVTDDKANAASMPKRCIALMILPHIIIIAVADHSNDCMRAMYLPMMSNSMLTMLPTSIWWKLVLS